MRFANSNVLLPPLDCNGYVIGWRTESDWVAGAFKGVHLSPLGFAACQSKKCTNKAIKYPTKLSSAQQNCQVHQFPFCS